MDIENLAGHLDNLVRLKAASRTKHLAQYDAARPLHSLRRWLRKVDSKTIYTLPPEGGIPREFIRQEPWEIEYLYMLARRARTGIIETGRFNGGSVLIFALANGTVPISSLDIAPQDDARLTALLSNLGCGGNVRLITGDSQHTKYPDVGEADLLYVDGDHSYAGCMADLNNWWDSVRVGGHVVLHDSYFGIQSQDAAIDFIETHSVEVVVQPYKLRNHKRHPEGSLCHFIKRGA